MIWSLETGGAQHLIIDIINEQCNYENITLIIINNLVSGELLNNINGKVNVIQINRPCGSKNIYYLIKLNTILLFLAPDYINTHDKTLLSLIPVLKFSATKSGRTVHGTGLLIRNVNRYNDIFAISKAVRDDIASRYKIESTIVYNGINFSSFQQKKDFKEYSKNRTVNLVQISRLDHKKKGQHLLIQALAILIHKYKLKLMVTFIGEGSSLDHLKRLAKSLDVYKQCNFLGNKEKEYICNHLKDFDILVQPSLHEGFGLTIVEAIASCVPVLVSDSEGPYEIIKFGEYGTSFLSGNYEDLADKILLFFDKQVNLDIINKVYASFDYCKTRYSIQKTAKLYLKAYCDSV